jgi:hypothetical protein
MDREPNVSPKALHAHNVLLLPRGPHDRRTIPEDDLTRQQRPRRDQETPGIGVLRYPLHNRVGRGSK